MEKSKKTKLNDLRGIDISNIITQLKKDNYLFTWDFKFLAKYFLSNYLNVDVYKVEFTNIVASYLKNIGFDKMQKEQKEHLINELSREKNVSEIKEAIKSENKFYPYICEKYLSLTKEPREELLSIFLKVKSDIKTIDETLEDIKSKIEKITKDKKTKEIQSDLPILKYYQEHNELAKADILNFIKNDIQEYALFRCYDDTLYSRILSPAPYFYNWNPNWYKPKRPNDLENKFGELRIMELRDLNKTYKNDKKKFSEFIKNHIEEGAISYQIRATVSKHHLLDERKEIIFEALSTYENGAKIIFANAVPNIIEGILHDICILIGADSNELLNEGLQQKLNRLNKVIGSELYYEYYSFRFRILRNSVAHGRLNKLEEDSLADLLLLDLKQICNLVFTMKIELNQKRYLIDEFSKDIHNPTIKNMIEYLLLDKVDIPKFYNLDKTIEEIEKQYYSENFWTLLSLEVDKQGTEGNHGIYKILKILSNKGIEKVKCNPLFKKLNISKYDESLAMEYFKTIKYYY